MTTWRRFWSLTGADRLLIVESATLLIFVRVALSAMGFLTVRRSLKAYVRMARAGAIQNHSLSDRVAWAVTAAARHVPLSTTCLVESVVAEAMLLRLGHPCELRLGVRPSTSTAPLDAHAWVESQGKVVCGAVGELGDYVELKKDEKGVRPLFAGLEKGPYPFFGALFQLIRGDTVRWRDLGLSVDDFFALIDREELTSALFSRIHALEAAGDWPAEVIDELSRAARDEAARELLRRQEIVHVLDTLSQNGLQPILIKGSALAYTVYATPAARPRLDTDLFIAAADVEAAREALTRCGYDLPPYCDDLFAQQEMIRTDDFGVRHVFDVHWKISTQPLFSEMLTYNEMLPRTIPVPALGPAARAASLVDALLLACIHPVMHHRNAMRLLWLYDIHLLASRLTADQFGELAHLAAGRKVAAICAHELRQAHGAFGTPIPAEVLDRLSTVSGEPSAEYLASERRWHHELISTLQAIPRFTDRARHMREVLFPRASYMLGAYGLSGKPLAECLLPALYAHRNLRGAWRIVTGKK